MNLRIVSVKIQMMLWMKFHVRFTMAHGVSFQKEKIFKGYNTTNFGNRGFPEQDWLPGFFVRCRIQNLDRFGSFFLFIHPFLISCPSWRCCSIRCLPSKVSTKKNMEIFKPLGLKQLENSSHFEPLGHLNLHPIARNLYFSWDGNP